jgi:DNA repair exonuclease SbcCD ATPase subunit
MSKGIEVTIHDCYEIEQRKGTLEDVAKALRFLGARVLVDTAGIGSAILQQLRRYGIAAESLPKVPRRMPGELNVMAARDHETPEQRRVRTAVEMGAIDPNASWVKQQWARVPVSVEAFDRLNNQVIRHEGQLEERAKATGRLCERVAQNETDIVKLERGIDLLLGELKGARVAHLERIEALEKVAHAPQDVPKLEAHLMLERRVKDLEAQHVSIVSSSVSVRTFNERVGALEREQQTWDDDYANYEAWKAARIAWEEATSAGFGRHQLRLEALEKFAAEQDRIVGRRDGESSNLCADVRQLDTVLAEALRRLATLEAYEADRDKANPPIDATACPRTYPLDPLTAEDPCEDCGRDQRKHDIRPDPTCDGLHTDGTRKDETYLERHNRERAEAQANAERAKLSEWERRDLEQVRKENAALRERLPYKPGFVDS